MSSPLDDLRAAVEGAAEDLRVAAGASRSTARPTLERPPKADFGDYSTNAAMLLAPVLDLAPRAIASDLGAKLSERLGPGVARVDIAGPGFLNLFLADEWYAESLRGILSPGFGRVAAATPETINVEFVSANPTGPATAAAGRHAAYGDALARLLEARGHTVTREYYVNDYGAQVLRLGNSVRARARGEDVPEDGYSGDYVHALAAAIPGAADADPADLAVTAVDLLLGQIKASMAAYRVEFDTWSSERAMHAGSPSAVDHALDVLESQGHVYESEGALWLRTTTFGDDKDRVLRKADGETTYFTSDIAYHLNKRERGSERLIDIFGADHHGYVGRMKALFAALGLDPEQLEIQIMQFVNLVERGERTSMSKRRGDFVTLDDLVADIGVDAARYFMLSRSHDTMIDLDLDLAREQSDKNPVYYVQYAHARTSRVLALAAEEGAPDPAVVALDIPLHASEKALIKRLLAFPGEVTDAADLRAPHRIATYALELARDLSAFYRDVNVRKAESDALQAFRLAECVAVRSTLATALGLLGVSAPDSM